MIEKLNPENLKDIIRIVNNNFLLLAKNPQGTRVIQKLFEFCSCEEFTDKMLSHTLDLLKDNNGYHIVLKFTSNCEIEHFGTSVIFLG